MRTGSYEEFSVTWTAAKFRRTIVNISSLYCGRLDNFGAK